MAHDAPQPRTQEQSIKARKHQLFEDDEPIAPTGPRRSFRDCLRETPAAPLSAPLKALLWALGTVVVLLLIAALATGGSRKPRPKPVAASTPIIRAAQPARSTNLPASLGDQS